MGTAANDDIADSDASDDIADSAATLGRASFYYAHRPCRVAARSP
jgi:hypothetical protein